MAKVIFIMFQPIWLLGRPPLTTVLFSQESYASKEREREALSSTKSKEIFTILLIIIIKLKKSKNNHTNSNIVKKKRRKNFFQSNHNENQTKQASEYLTNENFINTSDRVCNNINVIIGTVVFFFEP